MSRVLVGAGGGVGEEVQVEQGAEGPARFWRGQSRYAVGELLDHWVETPPWWRGVPAAGGGGGSMLDVAVALEACTHELLPGALLSTVVAAALLGDDAAVAQRLADGARVALALAPDLVVTADLRFIFAGDPPRSGNFSADWIQFTLGLMLKLTK